MFVSFAFFTEMSLWQLPFWLINHVEGTRITPKKLLESQEFARQKGLPLMRETLVPRVKGFVSAVQELRDMDLVLYDTTLLFTDSRTGAIEYSNGMPVGGPSMWSIMMGRPSSIIHLHVKR